VAGPCEYGNETSDSIKDEEFLEPLSDFSVSQGLCSVELRTTAKNIGTDIFVSKLYVHFYSQISSLPFRGTSLADTSNDTQYALFTKRQFLRAQVA
jgi:hypothetical protein